jgi:hypothetical protein
VNAVPISTLSPSAEKACDQRYNEQNQENEEQDLCDFRGARGNAPETEHGGNKRDDEKYQRIVEHL